MSQRLFKKYKNPAALHGAIAEKLRRVEDELNALASDMERIQAAAPAVQVPTITEPAKLTYTVPEAANLLNVLRPTMYTSASREVFPQSALENGL